MIKEIHLASTSPRRIGLLKQIGIPFHTIAKEEFPESVSHSHDPVEIVLSNSLEKARAVKDKDGINWVLSCDTIVFINGKILGKPDDEADARQKLRMLSSQWHKVYTGLCLYNHQNGEHYEDYEVTRVKFNRLTDEEIDKYVKSGEPMDKAGAYGIQRLGALLVERVDGCFYNVVGLPISKLMNLLEKVSITKVDIFNKFNKNQEN